MGGGSVARGVESPRAPRSLRQLKAHFDMLDDVYSCSPLEAMDYFTAADSTRRR